MGVMEADHSIEREIFHEHFSLFDLNLHNLRNSPSVGAGHRPISKRVVLRIKCKPVALFGLVIISSSGLRADQSENTTGRGDVRWAVSCLVLITSLVTCVTNLPA
jgi:hypothetical protein